MGSGGSNSRSEWDREDKILDHNSRLYLYIYIYIGLQWIRLDYIDFTSMVLGCPHEQKLVFRNLTFQKYGVRLSPLTEILFWSLHFSKKGAQRNSEQFPGSGALRSLFWCPIVKKTLIAKHVPGLNPKRTNLNLNLNLQSRFDSAISYGEQLGKRSSFTSQQIHRISSNPI